LHLTTEFAINLSRAWHGGDCVVVVHFAERYEIWAVGTELPAWLEHPLLAANTRLPDSTSWAGELDTYWCVEERQGMLAVPDTNWTELTKAIALDLDLSIPASPDPVAPFHASVSQDVTGSKLPLFPVTPVSSQAHLLLSILESRQSTFENDTHPKNEGNIYIGLSEAEAAELSRWAGRLDSWLIEVRLRCANEYRSSTLLDKDTPLVRLHPPPPGVERDVSTPEAEASAQAKKPAGKWAGRIGSVIGFFALCLFVLAIANVIASFPWLSVLIALPWVLYLKYRKDL
jgi:hypothetical protein